MIHNIFDQAPEDKLFPVCQELNVGVIARVPLDEGSLGGKMTRETKFPKGDWRAMYFGPKNLIPTLERVEKLKALLPPSMTLPQMALRYILSYPAVSTIIVGMRKPEHVRQNIAMSDAGALDAGAAGQVERTSLGPQAATLGRLIWDCELLVWDRVGACPERSRRDPVRWFEAPQQACMKTSGWKY